jgi:hypothetical protein
VVFLSNLLVLIHGLHLQASAQFLLSRLAVVVVFQQVSAQEVLVVVLRTRTIFA